MKKIIPIFLLTLLWGNFALAQIDGPDASGKCYRTIEANLTTQRREVPCPTPINPPSPPPSSPTSLGVCTYEGGTSYQNVSQADCSFPGVWKANSSVYFPLAPLPGLEGAIDIGEKNALGTYLNVIIKLAIGLAAVLAVVMIVMGGIQYMTTELISGKAEGKHRITNAIAGLIVALGAYLILFTINPDLLKTELEIEKTTLEYTAAEPETGIVEKNITLTKKSGGPENLASCNQSQMQTISVFGKNVTVNKGVVASLQRINQKWLAMPESQRYKVDSIGGYNCREVAGQPGKLSAHAYGLALDINPFTNQYGANTKSDMPLTFVQLFLQEGWGWGGHWISKRDPMHFSKYPPIEGGNGVLE